MKLLHLIRPINVARQRELELQLEEEKKRFSRATRETAEAIRFDFSPRNIVNEHPAELTLAVMIGGIFLGTFLQSRSRAQREERLQNPPFSRTVDTAARFRQIRERMTLPPHLNGHEALGAVSGEPIAQFELGSYKNFVYLLIDWHDREAWIIDPQSDLIPPKEALRVHGLKLGGILLTHTHHDHVAGVPALLKENPRIRIIAGALDHHRLAPLPIKVPLESAIDGATIAIGSLKLRAMHTPGHSAGEFSYFLEAQNGHPPFLFTGDTVFIRDCGRTDFPDGSDQQMFSSLQRIRALPHETVILPGHHYQAECASTLERELQQSAPFRCRSFEELADLP